MVAVKMVKPALDIKGSVLATYFTKAIKNTLLYLDQWEVSVLPFMLLCPTKIIQNTFVFRYNNNIASMHQLKWLEI